MITEKERQEILDEQKEIERQEKLEELEHLGNELQALKLEQSNLEIEIDNFELDNEDYIETYEEMLNNDNTVIINGIEYTPSYVLKNIDEIAYDQGLNGFVDSLDKKEDERYRNLLEDLENIDVDIEICEDSINELKEELGID